MAELYRYAAFISYSSKDAKFAQRLHRALESYGIPSSLGKFDLIGGGKANRIYPVFRDREELSAGHLGDQIEANLKASAALIVVCSPHGAASPWVQKEIEFFASQGRHAKIFAIIPDTAPLTDEQGADCTQSCFPPAFRGDALSGDKLEPLAADARKSKDGFRNAWLKIVAGMIGISPGQIIDRDKKRRRVRRLQLTAGISAATMLALLGGAALDASAWRTQLYQRADRAASEGRPAEATALAVGALPSPFAILPPRDEGADRLAGDLGRARLQAELGPLNNFRLSADGARLVIWRTDAQQTVAAYDLATGAKTELGVLGELENLYLSANGARLVIQRRDAQLTGAVFDLATGARTELGPLNSDRSLDESYFRLSADGARLVLQRRDAQGRGAVFDLTTGAITELGVLGQLKRFYLTADGARLVILRRDAQGTAAVFDLATGVKTELGALGPWDNLGLYADWLVIRRLDAQLTGAIYNLATGAKIELGPLRDFRGSDDRTRLAIRRNDAQQTVAVYDLATGLKTELGALGPLNRFRLSANGARLVIWRSDAQQTVAVFDLATGVKTELGSLGPVTDHDLSADGARLVIRREDEQNTGAVFDLATGAKTELGPLSSFTLSADGARLIIRRAEEQGTAAVFDLATGAQIELGPLNSFRLSADGARLVLQRRDVQGTVAVFDLATGAKTELGPLGPLRGFELSANGAQLLILRRDAQQTGAVFDLATLADVERSGAALGASICAANGHAIRPFDPSVRDPAAFSSDAEPAPSDDDRRAYQILRGRPWNPCDWRGIAAVFPNPEVGDDWFEGPRQWFRLIAVRWGWAPDYTCTESTYGTMQARSEDQTAARRRTDRANMCALYGPTQNGAQPLSPTG